MTHTLCLIFPSGHIQEYQLERGMATPTRDSMVFFGQVWEVTTKFKCWQTEWEWTHKLRQLRLSQTSESHCLKAVLTPLGILSFPGLGRGHRKNSPWLQSHSASHLAVPPSTQPALRPASNARTEQDKKCLCRHWSGTKLQRQHDGRGGEAAEENWNNSKDSALFSLLSARRKYLDKGF